MRRHLKSKKAIMKLSNRNLKSMMGNWITITTSIGDKRDILISDNIKHITDIYIDHRPLVNLNDINYNEVYKANKMLLEGAKVIIVMIPFTNKGLIYIDPSMAHPVQWIQHELGHVFMNHLSNGGIVDNTDFELEADTFMSFKDKNHLHEFMVSMGTIFDDLLEAHPENKEMLLHGYEEVLYRYNAMMVEMK